MFTLFRKEVAGFFSSLTGYIVIIVFLLANSLIMWIMPGQWNLLDSGYAGLDTLFVLREEPSKYVPRTALGSIIPSSRATRSPAATPRMVTWMAAATVAAFAAFVADARCQLALDVNDPR